jgi:hypothetical protein
LFHGEPRPSLSMSHRLSLWVYPFKINSEITRKYSF